MEVAEIAMEKDPVAGPVKKDTMPMEQTKTEDRIKKK